jgi:simple sugar transport system ATP-binding protein
MEKVTKTFPGVIANDKVDLEVNAGEIHALLGENGSGKTTLMNSLFGIYQPDSGEIFIDDMKVNFESPSDAIEIGIGMVHQHFMLVPTLTVTENIILGLTSRTRPWSPILDITTAEEKINTLAEKHGLIIDPKAKVWQLPVGAQQRVEILKALYRDAKLLILDEPTSVLAPQEVEDFINVLRSLAAIGKSIIFISHKLNEVMEIADNISVLRNGALEGLVKAADTTPKELAEMMVGRELTPPKKGRNVIGKKMLDVRDLTVNNDRGLRAVKNISFTLAEGEIVGVAGVDGNGQKELTEAIAGVRKTESGTINISGVNLKGRKKFRSIGHVTEDRQQTGIIMQFSLSENFALKSCDIAPFGSWIKLNTAVMKEHTEKAIAEFAIKAPSADSAISTLSGGNQQKLVMARELAMEPNLLLAAQPTRGLDVGAAEYVHKRLIKARDDGMAILLISTELEEVLSICDRIMVMFEGDIVGIVQDIDSNRENLGLMMAGTPLDVISETI